MSRRNGPGAASSSPGYLSSRGIGVSGTPVGRVKDVVVAQYDVALSIPIAIRPEGEVSIIGLEGTGSDRLDLPLALDQDVRAAQAGGQVLFQRNVAPVNRDGAVDVYLGLNLNGYGRVVLAEDETSKTRKIIDHQMPEIIRPVARETKNPRAHLGQGSVPVQLASRRSIRPT